MSDIYSRDEELYKHLYQIPPKKGRYIVLDTETTGLKKEDHIVELGACEIIDGSLTGGQFHIYIRPRLKMEQRVVDIHGITNQFYDEYYKDVYQDDKENLLNFSKWVGNSIIFAHNAPFDMNTVNKELYYWGLHEIPIKRYRCSMRIFREIISKNNPLYDEKYTSLEKCCEFFGLKTNDKIFHNALFDSFMTARLVCKIYEKIDSDPVLYKDFDYNNQSSLDSHFLAYKKQTIENYNNHQYYNMDIVPRNNSHFFPSHNNKSGNKSNSKKSHNDENTNNRKEEKKTNNETHKIIKENDNKEENIMPPDDVINELLKD
jgi:DNA polymerase III epsilon subunit family exonuclease